MISGNGDCPVVLCTVYVRKGKVTSTSGCGFGKVVWKRRTVIFRKILLYILIFAVRLCNCTFPGVDPEK